MSSCPQNKPKMMLKYTLLDETGSPVVKRNWINVEDGIKELIDHYQTYEGGIIQ